MAQFLSKVLKRDMQSVEADALVEFGPFRVDTRRRLLLRGDEVVPLPAKAFDVLLLLLHRPGETVAKDELMTAVWPDAIVEEGNLTQMIFLLRKALGESEGARAFIATVPRQGYRFVGELRNTQPAHPSKRRARIAAIAGMVALFAAIAWIVTRGRGQTISTIAVLPFEDVSAQKDQGYLCDGIVDEMIESLSQIPGLRVTARGSAFQFKTRKEDVRTIGSKLGVQAVLGGTVLREGNRFRIKAELASTSTGYRLWAESYSHNAGDVFAVERAIARSVAEALRRRAGHEIYMSLRYTADPAVYESYLRGRAALLGNPEKAVVYFNQTLEKKRDYAPAYAGLADAYMRNLGTGGHPGETLSKASSAIETALKLDDRLPEAHYSKALLLARNWDWRGAIAETERALQLGPSLGRALWAKGDFLLITGREQEARSAFQTAEAIDPMAPNLFEIKIIALLGMKRFDEMIQLAKQYPEARGSPYWLGRAYVEKGMIEDGIAQLEMDRARGGHAYGMLATAYVRAGRRPDALKLLDEMQEIAKHQYIKPSTIATVYFGLGDLDQGFRWLDRAIEEHDQTMMWMKLESGFAPARNDPRFKLLLKKVHLDE